MVYKVLAIALLVSTFGVSSANAADEFSPHFTNQAPAALSGEGAVNTQDLIAQQDDDMDAFADELNAIMPAAGESQPVVIDTDVGQFFKKKDKVAPVSDETVNE